MTTSPDKAALLAGVAPIDGCLGKPEGLEGAFDGVERMYPAPLSSTAVTVLEMARAAGCAMWWRGRGMRRSGPEQVSAVESSLGRTQLGPGEFMENYAMWVEQIKRTGAVHEPERQVAQSPIAGQAVTRRRPVQTIAEVAVRELRPTMGDRAQWYLDTLTHPEFEQPANTVVCELTGYPGTTFAQWAADNVGLFR
ncbi:hypothetical protein HNP40_000810 [Mycobacteroides chelonae]|nr:hypothetical protein [Mycobacteroides chelonae]